MPLAATQQRELTLALETWQQENPDIRAPFAAYLKASLGQETLDLTAPGRYAALDAWPPFLHLMPWVKTLFINNNPHLAEAGLYPAALEKLDLSENPRLQTVAACPDGLQELYVMALPITELRDLPPSIAVIDATDCHQFIGIETPLPQLKSFQANRCIALRDIEQVLQSPYLEKLELEDCISLKADAINWQRVYDLRSQGCAITFPDHINQDPRATPGTLIQAVEAVYRVAQVPWTDGLKAAWEHHAAENLKGQTAALTMLLRRCLQENVQERGGQRTIAENMLHTLQALQANPALMQLAGDEAGTTRNGCINQPVLTWMKLEGLAKLHEASSLSEALDTACLLRGQQAMLSFGEKEAYEFMGPEHGALIEVECVLALGAAANRERAKQGLPLLPGLPAEIAYSALVPDKFIDPERVARAQSHVRTVMEDSAALPGWLNQQSCYASAWQSILPRHLPPDALAHHEQHLEAVDDLAFAAMRSELPSAHEQFTILLANHIKALRSMALAHGMTVGTEASLFARNLRSAAPQAAGAGADHASANFFSLPL